MRAQPADPGELRIPFEKFRELEEELRLLREVKSAVPVDVALGSAIVTVDRDGLVVAEIDLQVLSDGWAVVPLLPAGTAVESATVDGAPLALTARGADLLWSVKGAGPRHVVLRYRALLRDTADGAAFDLPLPPAAALTVNATIPAVGQRIDIVPGTVTRTTEAGDRTEVSAQVPRTIWARLAWRHAGGEGFLATAAAYAGVPGSLAVDGSLATIRWRTSLGFELTSAAPQQVPVASDDVAIVEAKVDGRAAVLQRREGRMYAHVQGRGAHVVSLVFDSRVASESGPTGTTVWTPSAPVASFVVELPGDKDVVVEPTAGIIKEAAGNATRVSFHVPPAEAVRLEWSEALPAAAHELRVNAELFHLVRAEEGVLAVTTTALMEIARGKAQHFLLSVPADAVVNAVRGDGISDWRLGEPKDGARLLTVYVDRDVTGTYRFEIESERLVGDKTAPVPVPLPAAQEVHRQRGMVVLVRGSELEVAPETPVGLSEVGENQIPAWLRDPVAETVTHTFKYVEPGPALTVKLAPFDRELARLHVAIDTLFSLGEGVLRAAAVIEVTVKAGTFAELTLLLPPGINVLSATAPSLREHRVIEPKAPGGPDAPRLLTLAFTREMEGVVKVDLAWEQVLAPGDAKLTVPLVHVRGAVVEQGKVAIEALTAVEVRPEVTKNLSPLDAEELPRALVLRTTNPILLAYHYVHAEPPATLELSVKRHAEIAVQVAAIDRADYQSLWTRDGVVLTRARYLVRNRGKQFLRVTLPKGAVVWSAELAGQPVKPARDEGEVVLVPLSDSAAPFEVELVYAVQEPPLGFAGSIEGRLPTPDLIETTTSWQVWLPDDVEWGDVDTTMTVASEAEAPPAHFDQAGISGVPATGADRTEGGTEGRLPLRIEVPAQGRRIVLTKLLANVGATRAATFSVSYSAAGARTVAAALVFFGALALGLLGLRLTARGLTTARSIAVAVAFGGLGAVVAGGLLAGAWVWALPAVGVVGAMATWRWVTAARLSSGEKTTSVG